MNEKEITALVSLLDDEDDEILTHVENKIKSLGNQALPFLEKQWVFGSFDPILQKRIEDIINDLHLNTLMERLKNWKINGGIDLLQGLWIVATYQYPDLTLDELRAEIRKIYLEVWLEFREDLHPTDQIRVLNKVIFEKLQFTANTKNFHATANSMLNQVFESKKGNPISLCMVYMLVTRELGMPIFGVNLPNLFVLTYKTDLTQFYVNVFNKGLVFSRKDINNYLMQLQLEPSEIFYEPCNNIDIVKRFWNNIAFSFEKTNDQGKVNEVKQIIAILED